MFAEFPGWELAPRFLAWHRRPRAGAGGASPGRRAGGGRRLARATAVTNRIVANLDARNDRSAALCERLGMRRETHRLGDFWSKGTWTSSYEYGLLREEWRAAQG